eukprot:scaffold643_cov76-Amphora_coffeaeformis.AAC.1
MGEIQANQANKNRIRNTNPSGTREKFHRVLRKAMQYIEEQKTEFYAQIRIKDSPHQLRLWEIAGLLGEKKKTEGQPAERNVSLQATRRSRRLAGPSNPKTKWTTGGSLGSHYTSFQNGKLPCQSEQKPGTCAYHTALTAL